MEQYLELDALTFAQAYRAAATIRSTDEARPLINAIACEIYGDGVRLVATDSYALITVWVPKLGLDGYAEAPDLMELPDDTVIMCDPHGVHGKLCRHVESDAKLLLRSTMEPPPVTLRTGHAPAKSSAGQAVLDGLDGLCATLEYGREIRATAPLFEADAWLPYRTLFKASSVSTEAVQLNTSVLGRVVSAAGMVGDSIRWDMQGPNGAILWTVDPCETEDNAGGLAKSKPGAQGLIMPIRVRESVPYLVTARAPESDPA